MRLAERRLVAHNPSLALQASNRGTLGQIAMKQIRVQQGDITKLSVDAIVNAANELMLGGGGVDGEIHREAGPELLEACRAVLEVRPGVRCPTGQCRITAGDNLPARYVIHTVGPVWQGGSSGEADLLRGCYENSMKLAIENNLGSIAFPAISCGVFGYPFDQAAQIAVETINAILASTDHNLEVTLVAFDRGNYELLDTEVTRQP
jgi:O-acetyl-ADP-ribose deacetylase (regulator of RNase III)